jgi:hypothetical protein
MVYFMSIIFLFIFYILQIILNKFFYKKENYFSINLNLIFILILLLVFILINNLDVSHIIKAFLIFLFLFL